MKTLITGITGFAGGHLAEMLLAAGDEVWGCDRRGNWSAGLEYLAGRCDVVCCDITDAEAVRDVVKQSRPEAVYHLAAMAEPAACRRDPEAAHRVNVAGTQNIYEALVDLGVAARVLFVSTSHVYGRPAPEDLPLNESAPLQESDHPYTATKLEAERLSRRYAQEHGIDVVVVRPFNHTGPRRPTGYAISSWAEQIAAIEAGRQEPMVRAGNLESRRDFSDVRDVVRAYRMVVQHGSAGEVFNVGSGVARRAGDILDQLLAMSGAKIQVSIDTNLLRGAEPAVIEADVSHLRNVTGWRPEIPFETTLRDTLEDWRDRVR